MKRLLFMTLLMTMAVVVFADSSLTAEKLLIPEGKQAELTVNFNFDDEHTICNYQMEIVLPDDVSIVGEDVLLGPCHTAHTGSVKNNIVVVTSMNKVINGTSGLLLKVTVEAPGLALGTTLQGTLHNIKLGQTNETSINPADVDFEIEIVEDVTVLDENSTTAPEAATGVNVRVKRTINANEWSTIVLPFAMSAAQVKAAFGNDVQLADFIDYDYDGEEETITVNFEDATEMEANHPYIIRVSSKVEEFTVDGVDIDPDENPCVEYDNGLTGKKRKVFGTFAGTYVADFDFYNDAENYPLFLSGNKFYYATENTRHMKAFRAYFDFVDYLPEAEGAASRITMYFNSETTSIKETSNLKSPTSNLYDLQGRKVQKPSKGLYIKNGRKEVIK